MPKIERNHNSFEMFSDRTDEYDSRVDTERAKTRRCLLSQAERDRSLVEHLATQVLGLKKCVIPRMNEVFFENDDGGLVRLNLGSWTDAGMVWEKAREMGIDVCLRGVAPHGDWQAYDTNSDACSIFSDSGPRAICEAIARATG
jgi:hypothetical protein